ncbi:VOC family protein [Actinomadura sp. LOL_016]|uniref:VOC family protein n=1 Tax=unclassified Actinomadura TaxID=2626254 RepID=UPI003A7FEC85
MDANVRALGHVVVDATDLGAWHDFGTELLGLQCAERTDERLLFRMDHYTYRLVVQRSDRDGLAAAGWDVGNAASLDALTRRLADSGYEVSRADAAAATERHVEEFARLRDPDDLYDIELYWGKRNATPRFVSPIGATFVAGELGLGHIAQAVSDAEAYRRLYREIFGLRLSDHVDAHGGRAELEFLHCNRRHHSFAFIEVVEGVTPPTGIAHLMLEVDDLDTVGRGYDKVLAGAAPLRSTFGRHTNDEMTSWYVTCPAGFGIEYGVGGLLIDPETWLPTRYDAAHYWGHHRQPVSR